MPYQRVSTDWLASCAVGLGVHWTAQTAPRRGPLLEFRDAADRFRLADFLGAVESSGADYVIFTATHAFQTLPCPHPVVDAILPGRTCQRDLIGEIAGGLAGMGRKLILYYNHSCNHGADRPWEDAVGYHDPAQERLADNLCAIVRWLSQRYGRLIGAWWFDSSSALDPRGPRNSVTNSMRNVREYRFAWERLTAAAKAGNPDSLVTYNAGVAQTFLYTDHQDYWAGELTNLNTPPTGRFLESGLQWHGWTCLDDRRWLYTDNSKPPQPPLYTDSALHAYLSTCRRHQAPLSFNVICFQDGTLAEASVSQLQRMTKALKGSTGRPHG